MFICDVTKKCSKPGEPMIKVPVQFRDTVYTNKVRVISEEDDFDERPRYEMKVSTGTEIVKEICVTQEGLDILLNKAEESLEK